MTDLENHDLKIWTSQLDSLTGQFLDSFETLSTEQLNWKPSPQTWSIAQNIKHLIVVNETYFPVLSSLKSGTYKTPFIAKIGFLVTFIGKTVLNAVKPDRKKKMKTFPIWEPGPSSFERDILEHFKKHQAELKRQIESSKHLIGKGKVISSPANKYVVYRLEAAFDIIILHEQRHLEQAKELLSLIWKNTSL